MPYGIRKSLGGDTAATDARMERCVAELKAKGYPLPRAVAICKSPVQKSLRKRRT